MDKEIITFSATQQTLFKTGGIDCFAAETVKYVEARFDLGENWSGFDHIDAIWTNDGNFTQIAKTLDPQGVCIVPVEVLSSIGDVRVNLVGTTSEDDEVAERLTTYPIFALGVNANVPVSGSETQPITPSQFDQFVQIVIAEVEKVTGMTAEAVTLPPGSDATAEYTNGKLILGIPQGIQGEKGDTGETGNGIDHVSFNSDYSLSIIFTNGEIFRTPPIRGERGPAGADGRDGADGVTPNLSVGNVETLEPTQDAYVTRRGTDNNPIFDFGIPRGQNGTVPDLDLILPTDTASGDIASITDGQSVVPVKSLKVTLEPIQDLHGYDSPWTAGAGKNVLPFYTNGGNNLGLTVSYDEDEECYIINGTTTADGNVQLANPAKVDWVTGETYTLSVTKVSGSMTIAEGTGITFAIALFNQNYSGWIRGSTGATDIDSRLNATDTAFTVVNGHLLLQCWRTGTVFNNLKIRIQIEKGSEATSWTPYSNICPISGHTEVVTEVCGKNLLDGSNLQSGYFTTNGEIYPASVSMQEIHTPNYIPIDNTKNYTFSATVANNSEKWAGICLYDANKTFLRRIGGVRGSAEQFGVALTTSMLADGAFVRVSFRSYGIADNIQLEAGSTATDYEPYQGDTYTTALGRTVYGGTPDVVSGELVVDRAIVDLGTLTWYRYDPNVTNIPVFYASIPNAKIATIPICSAYKCESWSSLSSRTNGTLQMHPSLAFAYVADSRFEDASAFTSAVSGQTLCYELATPQTYQLDPQQVMLLHGTNNVWSDGEVELTYNADVQLWVLKKLGSGTRLTSVRPTLSVSQDPAEDESEDASEEEIK